MTSVLKEFWSGVLGPMMRRPERVQLGALCYKNKRSGPKVLLVTSRGTGRWIIPKGWPMKGKNSAETAQQEAWEEAGVKKGKPGSAALGSYRYNKDLDNGMTVPVRTVVYPIEVTDLSASFPEAGERERRWVAPDEAANLVDEPELKQILSDFAQSHRTT